MHMLVLCISVFAALTAAQFGTCATDNEIYGQLTLPNTESRSLLQVASVQKSRVFDTVYPSEGGREANRVDVSAYWAAPTLAWKKDVAASLVQHVLDQVPAGDVAKAITSFNDYSERHDMGMDLGSEKGKVIEKTVLAALAARHSQIEAGDETAAPKPLAVLEVGAHFGDGTLRILRPLLEKKALADQHHFVVSLETSETWGSGCQAIVAHALGSTDATIHHEVLIVQPGSAVAAAKAALAQQRLSRFDLVLFDHEHNHYLIDLHSLVDAHLIAPGGLVHADNAGDDASSLADYLAYVQGGPAGGPFTTHYEEIKRPYPDRVAISEYVGAGWAKT